MAGRKTRGQVCHRDDVQAAVLRVRPSSNFQRVEREKAFLHSCVESELLSLVLVGLRHLLSAVPEIRMRGVPARVVAILKGSQFC